MLVLVLKILGPVFLFGVSVVREWSMLRDKSTRQRAALVLGMGAVVTIAAAIGLVIDHNNQDAKLAAEQEDSAELRQKVTETLEEVTRARGQVEATRKELGDLKESTDAVVALYPNLPEREALELVVEELRELRARSAELEDQLTGLRLYSAVAKRDVLGYPDPYEAKSVISYSDDLTLALGDTWVERGGGFHPRCDQPTLDKFHAVTVSHPSFPFTYYALSECAFEAGKDTWRQYTDRALGILERTIQFKPPHRQHVQAYERLRARLEQQ